MYESKHTYCFRTSFLTNHEKFPVVPDPVDTDPLFLHGLLHVHVLGELAHVLHRGLRRQEERNSDEESKSSSRMGNPIGRCHGTECFMNLD